MVRTRPDNSLLNLRPSPIIRSLKQSNGPNDSPERIFSRSQNLAAKQRERERESTASNSLQMLSSTSTLVVHNPPLRRTDPRAGPTCARSGRAGFFNVRSASSSLTEKPPATVEDRDGDLGAELRGSAKFPAIRAAKRVVLVRHGQSTWNAEGRIQGSSNFAVLTKKGEAQAETSRQMLIDDSFDVCFTRCASFFVAILVYVKPALLRSSEQRVCSRAG